MLTKNLLKTRVRTGRLYPQFIKRDDTEALDYAEDLINLFSASKGETSASLDGVLSDFGDSKPYSAGLKKILMGYCKFREDDGSIVKKRFETIQMAQQLRNDTPHLDLIHYQNNIANRLGLSKEELMISLYADLPSQRELVSFEEVSRLALIDRYNVALVQGLLLMAEKVSVSIKGATIEEKRAFFRSMKFHQLLADVDLSQSSGKDIYLNLSGPLSLFNFNQAYGMKLANFFPRIIHMPHWEINADILYKKKVLNLKVGYKNGLVSHYSPKVSYIPEEFSFFVEGFNKEKSKWQLSSGGEYIHLGEQSYAFPDMVFSDGKGKKVYLELFHKWHAGQLKKRVQKLGNIDNNQYVIAVSRVVAKDKDIGTILDNNVWFQEKGLLFRDFPTPKSVLKVLSQF